MIDNKHSDKISSAITFFRQAHDSINHKRKYTGDPYWVHTEEVANIVASVTDDEDMFIAALGHDVLEDVYSINRVYSPSLIDERFGARVLWFINHLTDVYTHTKYPNFNRETRKGFEAARYGRMQSDVKTIKLADLISNTSNIVEHDPGFAKIYLQEKKRMLPFLEGGNVYLLQKAYDVLLSSEDTLKIKELEKKKNILGDIKVPEDPIAKEIDKGLEKAEKSISKSIKKAWKRVFG